MQYYRPYKSHLKKLVKQALSSSLNKEHKDSVECALNGEANRQLRHLVPLTHLRTVGAFFSGQELAYEAVKLFTKPIDSESRVLDPACGAGELLLACARKLFSHLEKHSLEQKIQMFSRIMHGRDIISDFALSAKFRLILSLAAESGDLPISPYLRIEELGGFFPNISQGDALTEIDIYRQASHIIMNPPFGLSDALPGCSWASGKVNAAATFLDMCVSNVAPDTHIVAILPDVLRCGVRYAKWRHHISSKASLQQLKVYGRFDSDTEVEVFLIELVATVSKGHIGWTPDLASRALSIGDLFDVSIGSVVDYRDKHAGRYRKFLRVSDAPPWGEVGKVTRRRRYSGRVVEPPFVVIRRTSRADDAHRAVATIVTGNEPLAVENHLLVLKPKDESLRTCRILVSSLQRRETSEWLNAHIRCRHLPKTLLVNLPVWLESVECRV